MIRFVLLIIVLPFALPAYGQNSFSAMVVEETTGEPVIGVNMTIKGTARGAASDTDGRIHLGNLEDGAWTFVFSAIGYAACETTMTFPPSITGLVIRLVPEEEHLEEIVVSTTRLSRHIDDLPTRVEAIAEEELEEKANMNSSNLTMLLNESTGISVQPVSVTSGNANLRLQGLDGRYTQILKDGFPMYGGMSSGLSLMQTPPLDLRQVEVIKGSASTLYGGGAIAGLVNLISKEPSSRRQTDVMVDQSSAGGTTGNVFGSSPAGRHAYSIFGSAQRHGAYDANSDGYSDLPRVYAVHMKPVYYLSTDAYRWRIGVEGHWEDRRGGRVRSIAGGETGYVEKNLSRRLTLLSTLTREHSKRLWTLKNSATVYDRRTDVPGFRFEGRQWSTFNEWTLTSKGEEESWIAGATVVTDRLDELRSADEYDLDYMHYTVGVFGQATWNPVRRVSVESGIRVDRQNRYGWFVLPRLSVLYKMNTHWSARLGGGLGYREPSVFNEESDVVHFRRVRPISSRVRAERSVGGNLDVQYNGVLFEKFALSQNVLFFYTMIDRPLGVNADSAVRSVVLFETQRGTLVTRGLESNTRIAHGDIRLFLGYSMTLAVHRLDDAKTRLPLTPVHRLNIVCMYESESQWRAGYEVYYTGHQRKADGSRVTDYWIMGLMAERKLGRISVYLNLENFLDTRLSRYERIVPPDELNPTRDLWAPLEGFTVNGGVKFRL